MVEQVSKPLEDEIDGQDGVIDDLRDGLEGFHGRYPHRDEFLTSRRDFRGGGLDEFDEPVDGFVAGNRYPVMPGQFDDRALFGLIDATPDDIELVVRRMGKDPDAPFDWQSLR